MNKCSVMGITGYLTAWSLIIYVVVFYVGHIFGKEIVFAGIYVWMLLPPVIVGKYKLKLCLVNDIRNICIKSSFYYSFFLSSICFLYALNIAIDILDKNGKEYNIVELALVLFSSFVVFFIIAFYINYASLLKFGSHNDTP